MKETHFATFGGGQLETFDIDPMNVILITENEEALREQLRQPPFDNKYCTTYPISYADEMEKKYGMKRITIEELLLLEDDDFDEYEDFEDFPHTDKNGVFHSAHTNDT